MCGITGFFDLEHRASVGELRKMNDRLHHRGPNAEGMLFVDSRSGTTWSGAGAAPETAFDLALGHRRLSILDLSDAGRQPMSSADGRFWIVFNGEIYNYVELRESLKRSGHRFHTGTDTEVLLAAYQEWGTDCFARLNGMWAFALWDGARKELCLSRDRMGVKPLYYAHGAGWLVFGSELKAVLAHRRVASRPNPTAIYDFLSLRLADHTEETFFEGIQRLPAAHCLQVKPGGRPRLHRYWDVQPTRAFSSSPHDEDVAIARFGELFEDAVRIRLRSDVPVGTCLSGGLDSSSIVVAANRLMFDELALDRAIVGDRQQTFSACFEDQRFDERRFIDPVIAATGASSHRVFPTSEELWSELPALLAHMDEPFHSTSQYSQYCVMRLARQRGVTVTLDGQGADELMAGYPAYHSVGLATLVRGGRLISSAREAAATMQLSGRGRSALELAARTAYGLLPIALTTPFRTAVAPLFASYTPEGRSLMVIRRDVQRRFSERRMHWLARRAETMKDIRARLHSDVFQFSLPCLLRYADRNSMAFSIESRMPMLDYRLVEHIFSLPTSLLLRGGWTKWVLRRAMEGQLPREIQWRKDKMGFVTPESAWLRDGKTHIVKVLSGDLASADFLDVTELRARVDEYVSGTSDTARFTDVFRWYILELWMRSAFGSERMMS